ncbi:hypothetical protein LCGC14_0481740 [marine sediment metagenome]|uniref:Uncharacterized protein n=1 Tax=marine sediment metagenome TaxID=412755 RepID=A0A0F9SEI9_9ZZZZ
MTEDEATAIALAANPDCSYADWDNGLDVLLRVTIVVNLWRNEECFLAGDPPRKVVEGFYR